MPDLIIVPADVVRVSGDVANGVAGEAVTQGQSVVRDTTDNNLIKLSVVTDPVLNPCNGIALNAADVGQPIDYIVSGVLDLGAIMIPGSIHIVGAAPGAIGVSGDLVVTWYSNVIGIALSVNTLLVSRINSGVTF